MLADLTSYFQRPDIHFRKKEPVFQYYVIFWSKGYILICPWEREPFSHRIENNVMLLDDPDRLIISCTILQSLIKYR